MDKIASNIFYSDESFNEGNAGHYSLSVEVSYDSLVYCIFDEVKNKYLVIESFFYKKAFSSSQLISSLENIICNKNILKLEFEKTNIVFKNDRYTFVPAALFMPDKSELYLKFNQETDLTDGFKYDFIKSVDLYNVYALPGDLEYFLNNNFKNYRIILHVSSLIEALFNKFKNIGDNKNVFINLNHSSFDIVVLENQKLILCNSFQFNSAEDFIYYLMFVFEQLKLNPEYTLLTILGEIETDSLVFEFINRYVRNISFIERNNAFNYSYLFDKIPQYFYYNLFNIRMCEL